MSPIAKRVLKTLGWTAGIIVLLIVLLLAYIQFRWDSPNPRPVQELQAPSDSASIAHGRRIFTYQAHCWTCHQNPESKDHTIPAGGLLFDLTDIGPGFGKWYSRNITPDVETGIGTWTDGEIVRALREGLRKDGTPLFPIMPIDWFHNMADEDALSVVAYLRTLPPVKHVVPAREPSFMAKALFTFGAMGPKPPVLETIVAPPRSVTVEYGKYLSNNLADCADCHTPRNLQDGHVYLDSMFAGSSFAFGGGLEGPILAHARNLTPDAATGIGSWSEEQFMNAVTSGMRPDSTVLVPIMPYGIYKSWDEDELRAVFTYLKSLPAIPRKVPPVEFEASMTTTSGAEHGREIFRGRCQPCHGEKGVGALPTGVALADVVMSIDDADLREFITEGQLNLHMPAFGKTLSDGELTDLIAYLRTIGVED